MRLQKIFSIIFLIGIIGLIFYVCIEGDVKIEDIFSKDEPAPAYYFKDYDVNIKVNADNSYNITETIDVFFTAQRHGLIRTIPRKTYMNRYALLSNGRVENYKYTAQNKNRDYIIKIGDANQLVTGDQRYVISYTYTLGFDALTKMDEIYYNIIGAGHNVKTEHASFTITMPKDFDASKLTFTLGKKGSRSQTGVMYSVSGNTITGALKGGLSPNEALTVALPLPEGYFTNTWRDKHTRALMGDYYEYAYLIILILAIVLWGIWGKNRIIFPTIEFYPPKDLNPSEIGYIYDGEVDPYDITALIIYWANQKKLSIEEVPIEHKGLFNKKKKSRIILHKTGDLDDTYRDYEVAAFNALFRFPGSNASVAIDELRGAFISAVSPDAIKNKIQSNKDTRVFYKKSSFISLIIKILCFVNAFWFCTVVDYGMGDNFERSHSPGDLFLGVIYALALCIPMWNLTSLIRRWNNIIPRFRFKKLLKRGFWVITTFIGFWFISAYFSSSITFIKPFSLPIMFVSGYIVCFLISLLSTYTLKRTLYGDRQKERILGLKEFIEAAEKDRIIMLVEENPEYFYNVLPYAMALGITDNWARKFEDILISPPSWYTSPRINYNTNMFNAYYFTQELTSNTSIMADSISSIIEAFSSSSSGSSSGGGMGGSSDGGSSGGGSGGGGSSDW